MDLGLFLIVSGGKEKNIVQLLRIASYSFQHFNTFKRWALRKKQTSDETPNCITDRGPNLKSSAFSGGILYLDQPPNIWSQSTLKMKFTEIKSEKTVRRYFFFSIPIISRYLLFPQPSCIVRKEVMDFISRLNPSTYFGCCGYNPSHRGVGCGLNGFKKLSLLYIPISSQITILKFYYSYLDLANSNPDITCEFVIKTLFFIF